MLPMLPIKFSYVASVCALFLLMLLTYGTYLKIRSLQIERDQALLRVSDLQNHIKQQNEAINEFNKEANTYKTQVLESRRQANELLDESNKKYAILLKDKAPVQCEAAVKWGAKKAKELFN